MAVSGARYDAGTVPAEYRAAIMVLMDRMVSGEIGINYATLDTSGQIWFPN
jgi:hypothetical protein